MTETPAFDELTITNTFINGWLSETRGLPITLQLSKLGLGMAEIVRQAYEQGKNGTPKRATYSPLDNIEAAKSLQAQLILEKADVDSGLDYEEQTSNIPPDDSTYEFQSLLGKLINLLNEYTKER